jgi:HlyD family secretion protein
VTSAKAVTGPISQVIGYNGTVQASDSVNVVPVISGRVTKLNVDVGSVVKSGDLIAELDKATLNAQVAQAQAGLEAANAKLAQIKAGARPEAVAAANANTASAQAKLDALKNGARPENVAVAQANLQTAQAKLAAIQAGSRAETVAQAKANLQAAQAKLQQLLDGATSDQVAAAQLTVEQAKDSLLAAQTTKDAACRIAGASCNAAQAAALAAETALNVQQQNLKTLTDPPTQDAINQAKDAVDAAQQAYNLTLSPYTVNDVAQAQAAVDSAKQQLALAQAPYLSTDVAQAQAAVDAATNQAKLAAQPYTDVDLQSAQAAVDQAQAALQLAQSQLAQAEVSAPFDGVVTAKFLSVGALASPSSPIVSLMSPNLQVQFSIDETRISNIKAGQTVSLTTSAFPGKQFPGTVQSVYPSANATTHTFTVLVQPNDSTGSLRAGMFVTLNVTTASIPDATLIPSVAIVQNGAQSVVYVVSNGVAHAAPITAGIADDTNTQIVSGLKPGDEVVTSNQSNLQDGATVRVVAPNGGGAAAGGAAGGAGASNRNANATPANGTGQGTGQNRGGRPTPTPTP